MKVQKLNGGDVESSSHTVGLAELLPVLHVTAGEQPQEQMEFAGKPSLHHAEGFPCSAEDEGRDRTDAAHDPSVALARGTIAVFVHAAVFAMVQAVLDAPVSANQSQNLFRCVLVRCETPHVVDLHAGRTDGLSAASNLAFPGHPAHDVDVGPASFDGRCGRHLDAAGVDAAVRLVNGFATLDVPSRSLKYAFSGATQVFGIAFDADQKVGLLVHHHLESLVDRVQRVHSQNAPRQIVESRDQLLSPGDLLALPGSEGLAEKRGSLVARPR